MLEHIGDIVSIGARINLVFFFHHVEFLPANIPDFRDFLFYELIIKDLTKYFSSLFPLVSFDQEQIIFGDQSTDFSKAKQSLHVVPIIGFQVEFLDQVCVN